MKSKPGSRYKEALESWERDYLLGQLALHRGNQCATAQSLGVHRNTMYRKLMLLGVTDQELKNIRRTA